MSTNGYAKDVLVSHRVGRRAPRRHDVVVAEVDENPDLYDEGHIPGAVRLHWKDDLQDPLERDLIEKAEFEQLMGRARDRATTRPSSSTATRTTGSPPTRTGI